MRYGAARSSRELYSSLLRALVSRGFSRVFRAKAKRAIRGRNPNLGNFILPTVSS